MKYMAIAFVALGMLVECRSPLCQDVVMERDTVDGTFVYQPASTKTAFVMADASIGYKDRSSFKLNVHLKSSTDGDRFVLILLSGLTPGAPQVLAGGTLGRACLVLQTHAEPTCLALNGTVEVRRLEADCYQHESGVSSCAENIDVRLHATTDEMGLSMRVDLDIVRAQRWRDVACSDND